MMMMAAVSVAVALYRHRLMMGMFALSFFHCIADQASATAVNVSHSTAVKGTTTAAKATTTAAKATTVAAKATPMAANATTTAANEIGAHGLNGLAGQQSGHELLLEISLLVCFIAFVCGLAHHLLWRCRHLPPPLVYRAVRPVYRASPANSRSGSGNRGANGTCGGGGGGGGSGKVPLPPPPAYTPHAPAKDHRDQGAIGAASV